MGLLDYLLEKKIKNFSSNFEDSTVKTVNNEPSLSL